MIQRVRGEGRPVVLLDGGDVLKGGQLIPEETFRTAVRAMDRMGYQAMALGERELGLPLAVLRDTAASLGFPFLCTNLQWPDGPVRPFTVVESGNVRVGVLAVIDPALAMGLALPDAQWHDPVTALNAMVPKVRAQADMVVVLSHMGRPKSLELARRVPDLDVVVVSHALGIRQEVDRVGKTLVVQASYKGEYLGHLRLDGFKSSEKVEGWKWETLSLAQEVPKDPAYKAMIDDYLVRLKAAKRERESQAASERRRKWLQETSPEEFFKTLNQGKVVKP